MLYEMKSLVFSYDMEAGSNIANSNETEAGSNVEKL